MKIQELRMKKTNLQPKERIDILEKNQLKIIQEKDNYCFSLDSILLSKFVKIKKNEKIVDLGTGCGVIPLMIFDPEKNNTIYAVEIQEKLANIAKKNVFINNLQDRIHIINDDMKKLHKTFGGEWADVIISNPPYIPSGSGKQSVKDEQLIARHEVNIDFDSLIAVSSHLLKKRGRLYLIHRADSLVSVIMIFKKYNIEPKLLQFVYTKKNDKAGRFLIEGRKDGGRELKVLPPQVLTNRNN